MGSHGDPAHDGIREPQFLETSIRSWMTAVRSVMSRGGACPHRSERGEDPFVSPIIFAP